MLSDRAFLQSRCWLSLLLYSCAVVAMPPRNDLEMQGRVPGLVATLILTRVKTVPGCGSGDKCCDDLYYLFIPAAADYFRRQGIDVRPVISSGAAAFYVSHRTVAIFKCFDIRRLGYIPRPGVLAVDEVTETGYYGLQCPEDQLCQIIRRVPIPLKPLFRNEPPTWVFLDKVICVPRFWAFVIAVVMFFIDQCVETQSIRWHDIPGLWWAAVWTTNTNSMHGVPEGRPGYRPSPGPQALPDNQVDVFSIGLYIASQNGDKKFKLNELFNVSAMAWNSSLTKALWAGEDSFVLRACVTTNKVAVNLHVGVIFDPAYYLQKALDQKALPGPKKKPPQKALPP